jgi:Ca-activated chloride channel homolog
MYMAAVIALGAAVPAFAFGPPAVNSNDQGIKDYNSEKYQEAFQDFANSLAHDSTNPAYHFNLGDSFYKGGELPKAMAEFEGVEQSPKASPKLKYKAMFNAGNAAVEAKDIARALQYYQRALEYQPDSQEVKTNIELALKENQKGGGGEDQQKQKQGGQGDKNDKQQQNQGDKKQEEKRDQTGQPQQPTPKPKPQQFKSQALNENDVQRILEELKRQEEEIRARQYKENRGQEHSVEKDW